MAGSGGCLSVSKRGGDLSFLQSTNLSARPSQARLVHQGTNVMEILALVFAWIPQWVAWSPEVPLSLGGSSHTPSVSEPLGIWSDQKGRSHPSFARRWLPCSPACWVYAWAPCGRKEFIGPSSYLLTGKTTRGRTPHRVRRQGPPFWGPIRLAHPAPCLREGLRVLSPHPSFPISIECSLVPL